MADDRTELLHTQAMQACLTAMGATQVNINGHEWGLGGVMLDSKDQLTSSTVWRIGEDWWRYDVTVRVDVTRRKVDR